MTSYETATAQEQGWADLLNGELLDSAESNGFTVLLTADANIRNQQNISDRNIAVLVLRASNNRLVTHAELVDQIHNSLTAIQPGQVPEIFHPEALNRD